MTAPLPDTTLAWLAALIDGEGSVMLNTRWEEGRRRGIFATRAIISISNTDLRLMDALVERVGSGRVYEHVRPQARQTHSSRSYTWRLNVTEIRVLGPLLLPWLVLKQRQLELLLEALALKTRNTPRPGTAWAKVDGHTDRIRAIQAEIQHLNRRGKTAGPSTEETL